MSMEKTLSKFFFLINLEVFEFMECFKLIFNGKCKPRIDSRFRYLNEVKTNLY